MNKVSKITIITINYDDLGDLKKTIQSVDSQKSRPQKHIIVSKKLKLNQLTKFKKKYRRFILGKDNSLFNAMNIGKKYSLNSPVIFLNSGDIFYNNNSIGLIQKYYKVLKKNKVVIFKTVLVSEDNYFYPKKKYYNDKNYLPHSSFIFYNSKHLSKINFDEKMIVTADGKWMRQILKKSNGLIKSKYNLVLQNLDGQSSVPSTRTILLRFDENIWSGIKEIIKFLIKLFLNKSSYFRVIYFKKYDS